MLNCFVNLYCFSKLLIMSKTNEQYDDVVNECSSIFKKKTIDYGTAWRILRPSSLTDQLYIKAQRIRTIQEKKTQKVADSTRDEFIGIINYSAMALIQLELGFADEADINAEKAIELYQNQLVISKKLMQEKNHDYGEAWRNMRISSMTDLILQKLLRIKSIENNEGATLISEGLDANYLDIINYAVFVLILMNEIAL